MGVRNVRWSRRRLVRAAAVASGLAVVCGEDDEVEQQQLPARAPGTRGAGSESPLASIRPNKLPPVVVVVGSVDRRLGWAVPRMVVVVGELGVMQRRGVRYVLAARGRYKGRSGTCSAASIPRVALGRLGGMKGLLFFPLSSFRLYSQFRVAALCCVLGRCPPTPLAATQLPAAKLGSIRCQACTPYPTQ